MPNSGFGSGESGFASDSRDGVEYVNEQFILRRLVSSLGGCCHVEMRIASSCPYAECTAPVNCSTETLGAPLLLGNSRSSQSSDQAREIPEKIVHFATEEEMKSSEMSEIKLSELQEGRRVRTHFIDKLRGWREIKPNSVAKALYLLDAIPGQIRSDQFRAQTVFSASSEIEASSTAVSGGWGGARARSLSPRTVFRVLLRS
jgi:hypothetical protein